MHSLVRGVCVLLATVLALAGLALLPAGGVTAAKQSTSKFVRVCISESGVMRVHPGGKSLKCRPAERALMIRVNRFKKQKVRKAGAGAAVCINRIGRPRLNLSGTCGRYEQALRLTFVSKGSATVQLTCITTSGLLNLPGVSGECRPDTIAVPVTLSGDLALPPVFQRPWQATPNSADPIRVAIPPASSSATPTAAPSPTATPSASPTPKPTPTATQDDASGGSAGSPNTPSPSAWPSFYTTTTTGYNQGRKTIFASATLAPSPSPTPTRACAAPLVMDPETGVYPPQTQNLTNCTWRLADFPDPNRTVLRAFSIADTSIAGSMLDGAFMDYVQAQRADLSGFRAVNNARMEIWNIQGARLTGADFTGVSTFSDFEGAYDLVDAHLASYPSLGGERVWVAYQGDGKFSLVGGTLRSAPNLDLRDGVLWRAEEQAPRVTMYLNGANLSGLDWKGGLISGNVINSDLRGIDFECPASVTCDNDYPWAMPGFGGQYRGSDFSGAHLRNTVFGGGFQCTNDDGVERCVKFVNADMRGIMFNNVSGDGADFTGANLSGSRRWGGSTFLRGAKFVNANFTNATSLAGLSYFASADFTGAVLDGADLSGTNLTGIVGTPASATGTIMSAATKCRDGSLFDSGSMTAMQCLTN